MNTTWRGASHEIDLLTVQPDVLVAAISQLKTSFPQETWNQVSEVFDVPKAELETSPHQARALHGWPLNAVPSSRTMK